MNLPVPVVGDEAGPQYAIDINACLAQIDSHDHTPGQGVQITPSALNLNADVPFNSNNATLLRSARFVSQGSPIAASTDLNCLSVSGVDLYYRDGSGNIVRITQSGGVAGSPGSIANLVSPASASYVAINSTFVWQSDANVAASMDFRSAILRNSGASSFGLTLQAPALSGDVTQTLPQVPAATAFVTMASTGSMGTTIPIAQGITTSMIADLNITNAKLADDSILEAKYNSGSVSTRAIADDAVTWNKLGTLPYGATASCGTFTTSATSQTAVTNLSLAYAGTGRPLMIRMSPAAGASVSELTLTAFPNSVQCQVMVGLYKNGSLLTSWMVRHDVFGGNVSWPPSGFSYIEASPGNITNTYVIKLSLGTTGQSVTMVGTYLEVYEL